MKAMAYGAIGALLIVAGVVAEKSAEKLASTRANVSKAGKIVGRLMFVLGWIAVALVFSAGGSEGRRAALIASAFGIVVAVGVNTMATKTHDKRRSSTLASTALFVFVLAWLVFGAQATAPLEGCVCKYSGTVAAVLVLLSTLYVLPKDRELCAVDSMGYPLFVLAWAILIVGNAKRVAAVSAGAPRQATAVGTTPSLGALRSWFGAGEDAGALDSISGSVS